MNNPVLCIKPALPRAFLWCCLGLIAALCSGDALAHKKSANAEDISLANTTAVIYNSPTALSLGQNRLIIRAENQRGQFYGGPDKSTTLQLTQGSTSLSIPTHWVWTSPGYSGFYVANVVFDKTGEWQAILQHENTQSKALIFSVSASSVVPSIGQEAYPSDSKVLSDTVTLADLTTDDNPDADFYQLSIEDAVQSGKPSVIIFATPDLCRTAVCGPVMKEMKTLASRTTDTNFIHVEIYEPLKKTNNKLVPVAAVVEWRLPSEPWTFLVDADGSISAKFEGYITADEVSAALAQQ